MSAVVKLQSGASPVTLPGFSTFSYGFDPVRELEKWNVAQSVRTVNGALADRPDRRPLAEIECLPGSADAGTETVTGPKLPAELVVAVPRRAVPK